MLILNNPHNPTGSFTEKKVIDELAKGLINFPHVAILCDEIYDRLIFDNKEFQLFSIIQIFMKDLLCLMVGAKLML